MDNDNTCPICLLNESEKDSTCVNGKCKMCRDCRIRYEMSTLRNSCPTCRGKMLEMPDLSELPCTDFYTPSDILGNSQIKHFVDSWKCKNFMRGANDKLLHMFDDSTLSLLSSAKKDTEYTLYRGINGKALYTTEYNDKWPSSWTINEHVAKKFVKSNGQILTVKVPSKYVFIDFNVLCTVYDLFTEQEVILFGGTYKLQKQVTIIAVKEAQKILHVAMTKERTIEDFTVDNRDSIISTRVHSSQYFWNIVQLKALCDKLGVKYLSRYRKPEIVDKLIQYNQSNQVQSS